MDQGPGTRPVLFAELAFHVSSLREDLAAASERGQREMQRLREEIAEVRTEIASVRKELQEQKDASITAWRWRLTLGVALFSALGSIVLTLIYK